MSTFLLVRHAATAVTGKVMTGRNPGVVLTEEGSEEAEALAEYLSQFQIEALYCSPLQRACDTGRPLSKALRIPLRICQSLNELDFGAWTGLTVDKLQAVPQWQRFNNFRSTTAPPGGELMLEVQARMVKLMEALRLQHRMAVLVTHADVIRATVCHYLGMPLDFFYRIEISPASFTTISLNESNVKVLCINQQIQASLHQNHENGRIE